MNGVVSEQGDPIMKGADWWISEYDKADITSIEIKRDTDIPNTAIYSWDVSAAQDRSVIAYLEDDGSGNQTYKVTIGGRGGVIANRSSQGLFQNFINVVNFSLDNFNTSKVTTMVMMFYRANISQTSFSNFNTSKVTNMSWMFKNSEVKNLDLSNFVTTNVINMGRMFEGCYNLTALDLGNFNTSRVTNMLGMFTKCESLSSLDISNFDTTNVETMSQMFQSCSSLVELDLSSFDTSNVTNITSMFYGCSNLRYLNMQNAEFHATHYDQMFSFTSNLKVIVKDEIAKEWIEDKLGSNGTVTVA